jgi:predicted transcriptional regulator
MARDLQRFRKTYGFKRVPPRYEEISSGTVLPIGSELETITVAFTNEQEKTVLASKLYSNPVVLVSPNENVNVYIPSIASANGVTTVTVAASAPFTGEIYIAIAEETP